MNLPTHLCERCNEPSSQARCRQCTCHIDGCREAATGAVDMDRARHPLCAAHTEQFVVRVAQLRAAAGRRP
jgi:hypothetical protein